jgi:hypothetical protein
VHCERPLLMLGEAKEGGRSKKGRLSFLHGIRGSVRVNGFLPVQETRVNEGFTYVIEPKIILVSTAPHRYRFSPRLEERYSPLAIGPRHEMVPIWYNRE